MAITVSLHHKTHYRYERAASLSPQIIRLRPAPHSRTPILSYSLSVSPKPHFLNWQQDPQGNYLARVVFPERINEFKVEVDLVAEMPVINPYDFFLEPYAEQFPFKYDPGLADELEPYLCPVVDTGPLFDEFFATIDKDRQPTINFLTRLNSLLQAHIAYNIRMEAGIQTPEETLQKRSGSCRDSAWLLINLFRNIGLAARFVSGYLIQLTADLKAIDGPSGTETDFTDLHAWAEVYLPGAGWVGLDPTSGLLAGEGHIPLACSPHPLSAAPITGLLEDVPTTFEFDMTVKRINELPRSTKPYSDEEWERVMALGLEIDRRLEEQDARLTMGGEPTFISIDDPDGPEWNTVAVGPRKRVLSEELLRRLWKRFAKGGVLHYGQGKWYPGESLPRWAYTCFWRKDGEPVWKNEALLGKITDTPGYTFQDARRFAAGLSDALGVQSDFILPGYEDVAYYLWKEQRLPANVDPTDNRLEDPEERTRMAKVFERGLNHPRGWVMPLKYQMWQSRWKSSPWKLRSETLMLIPGDSPMGLRLPLNSLTWTDESGTEVFNPVDPSSVSIEEPLPRARQPRILQGPEDGSSALNPELRPQRQSLEGEDRMKDNLPSWIVRTALCVEERDGRIYVFVPPLESAEAYLDLVAAIEHTAEQTGIKVIIEGEKPPHDPRINSFEITPDPGVIEVNIHPSETWQELVEKTLTLYEDARQTRLGTEKFMLDGRHTGTGGGNHLVFGGKSPQDSPFLRRPDLLGSMVSYWHHHPSLSYLFASLFIGPTSQSPRIDEARNDALYELEIAFDEIRKSKGDCPPWLVDRIFRHLLTDITGNTHRAEFCIDKLFNPDRSSGRLGLLELRSFEMPPHERMSLAQQLLVRGLISMLWKTPYAPKRLIRWGTQLHDRFLLPDFVWHDLMDVLSDLKADGQGFDSLWFQAHYEFRFPWYGKIQYRDLTLDLRQALEPWHVLGEEGSAGSTVRFVDSSVERLQVKLTGFIPERYEVHCNGRVLPLVSTGREGEYICAVRYRAWQPASCLHPTLEPDVPLVFDLVDTWSGTIVAGCTYHVGHPGGRNYEQFPINSNEAEGRRLARFTPFGHSPGPAPRATRTEPSLEFPYTLDLRRQV
jgi:uncharacterized protein (DUF2126 family)